MMRVHAVLPFMVLRLAGWFLGTLLLLAGLLGLGWAARFSERSFAGSRETVVASYPPPSVRPPHASPTPDDGGYLAPPRDIPHTLVPWSGMRLPGLLSEIRVELSESASAALSARVASRFDLGLTQAGFPATEAGIGLTQEGTKALLDAMFASGAAPVLQGFFESEPAAGPPCLIVLSHPWPAGLPHPPAPTQRSGAGLPAFIEPDAAAFRFCADSLGEWIWMDWWHGGYEPLLRQWDGAAPFWNATYRVLRP